MSPTLARESIFGRMTIHTYVRVYTRSTVSWILQTNLTVIKLLHVSVTEICISCKWTNNSAVCTLQCLTGKGTGVDKNNSKKLSFSLCLSLAVVDATWLDAFTLFASMVFSFLNAIKPGPYPKVVYNYKDFAIYY